jgi:hypothetical protein
MYTFEMVVKVLHYAYLLFLLGECKIECLTIVKKRCFFLGTFYSNAYGD